MNQTPEIISQAKIEEADYNALKITLLGLIGVASSVFTVYEFDQFLSTFQYAFLWFALFGMLVFLVVNILNIFFIKHFAITWGIIVVETFLPIVFFLKRMVPSSPEIILAGFLLFFICTVFGVWRGVGRLRNSVKLKFFEVARSAMPKLVSGFLLLASCVFYAEYFVWNTFDESMGKAAVSGVLTSVEPIVHFWFSGISADQTVGELFQSVTESQLKNTSQVVINGIPVDVKAGMKELTPEMRTKIISALSSDLQQKAETKVGALNATRTVKDTVYQLIRDWFGKLQPNIKIIIGIIITTILFFSVKGVAFLIYWLIEGIAFLIFKLLIVSNFAVMSFESRNRDFVILP